MVVPDVIVEHDGNEWKIHLNNDYIPRLRISSTYRDLIAKGSLSKGERDYLKDRMRAGKFLIDSIEQRQRTIERITREILKAQMPFFEHGVSMLKPLTMTQIADVVGVHETTVSRAIANKYIRTPHGVFEFKYFFTPGYQNDSGASVSNTSVKEMIADLVAGEDKGGALQRPGAREQAPGEGDQHRTAHGRKVPRGARDPAEQPAPRLQVGARIDPERAASEARGVGGVDPRREGDHAGVVARVRRAGGEETCAGAQRPRPRSRTEGAVVGDPPGEPHARVVREPERRAGLLGEGGDDGRLVARAEVGQRCSDGGLTHHLHAVAQARLEPREAEVELPAPADPAREFERARASRERQALDLGPARVAEPEELRPLVQRLARRVVARRGDRSGSAGRPRSTRGSCCRPRRSGPGAAGARRAAPRSPPASCAWTAMNGDQACARRWFDADDGEPSGASHGLRGRDAQREACGEARAARDGDLVDPRPSRRLRAPARGAARSAQVLARRDVGDHAAVLRVERDLAVDPLAGDPAARVKDRQRGLVARALEGEDHLSYSWADRRTSSAASSWRSSIGAKPKRSLKSAGSVTSGREACWSSLRSSSAVMTTSTCGAMPFPWIMTPLGVK